MKNLVDWYVFVAALHDDWDTSLFHIEFTEHPINGFELTVITQESDPFNWFERTLKQLTVQILDPRIFEWL